MPTPSLLDGLLVSENPAIRWRAAVELLDRPLDDPSVRSARAVVPSYPPVARLLAAQKPGGYWGRPDYYLPRHSSTFWTLTVLADLGISRKNDHVRRAWEYLAVHQQPDGRFCRLRRVPRQGLVWDADTEPCTQARIVRFLVQFGYGDDPRTQAAFEWLLSVQRPDGMFCCRPAACGPGCLRATLDFLRAAVLLFTIASGPAIGRAGEALLGLLLHLGVQRHHVPDLWRTLQYPYFCYGLLPALDVLARLGYDPAHPRIAPALAGLLARRLPDGSWPLDEPVSHPPLDFGKPGLPNPWLTLDALAVLKRFGVQELSENQAQN
jgi:hypothetical protein